MEDGDVNDLLGALRQRRVEDNLLRRSDFARGEWRHPVTEPHSAIFQQDSVSFSFRGERHLTRYAEGSNRTHDTFSAPDLPLGTLPCATFLRWLQNVGVDSPELTFLADQEIETIDASFVESGRRALLREQMHFDRSVPSSTCDRSPLPPELLVARSRSVTPIGGALRPLATRHDPSLGSSSSSFLRQEVIENVGRCAAALRELPLVEQQALGHVPSTASRLQAAAFSGASARLQAAVQRAECRASLPPAVAVVSRVHSAREKASSSARRLHPPPARVPVVVIGAQRFAAPLSRDRPISKRKRAMMEFAHVRASNLAGPDATPLQVQQLQDALVATHELAEYGAAHGTLDKDDHAWEYWERFSKQYGWDPLIDPEFARTRPHEVSQRLAIFQAWVYPQLRGRKQADAKPRSVFDSYVLAIIRVLGREHVPMPKAKSVEHNLAGIMRTFKAIHGHEALMPGRKQPLTPAMWARIEALTEGAALPGRVAWSPAPRLRDRNLLRLGRVLWRTGHRLGEIVWHPSGEVNYLTRACVSISKADGSKIGQPTATDWRALAAGDCILLAPCTSKSDQFGEEHCPFPSILPYDGSDTDAAAGIRDIELEQPCAAAARRTTPLFCDAAGVPYSYSMLHKDLRAVLTALFGKSCASAYSWHSVRIGLACALCAADAPDAVIQMICRWASPDSLKVYRQMGIEKNVFWVTKAHSVTFDATRVNNIPALDRMTEMQEQLAAFSSPDALASPLAGEPSVLPATPKRTLLRPMRAFVVPGGTVQAHASDAEGLVGLSVLVPRSFWSASDLSSDEPARIPCVVAAECAREFRHPDGTRSRTYLLEWRSQYFPIKRESLVRVCLSAAQRAGLNL